MVSVKPSARRCFLYSLAFVIPFLGGVGAEAATYYVAKTGNDAMTCASARTLGTPKLTINSALACLTAPGDTLYVRAGTYVESIIYTSFPVSGTQANPITVARYQNETVWLAPTSGCRGILVGTKNWITFDGINLNGINLISCSLASAGGLLAADGNGPTGLVLRNMEIKDSPGSNLMAGDHVLIENLRVHGTGWRAQAIGYGPGSNGLYLAGIRNSIVRHNLSYDNMCFGIRVFHSIAPEANNNIIDSNISHTNGTGKGLGGTAVCGSGGGGIVMGDTDNVASNNIIYNNVKGIWLYNSPTATNNNAVYNNSIYNNTYGIIVGNADVNNTIIKNNLVVESTSSNYVDAGSGTITANNRMTGLITDCSISTVDFRLKAGAPCIDAGTAIAAVTSDFAGIPRPQGAAHDIGAHEVSGTDATVPMAPVGLTIR